MTTRELPQRMLALELRYAIDVARKQPGDHTRARVAALLSANPVNAKSRHVAHNLGVGRIEWLRERPSLGWKEHRGTKPKAAAEGSPRRGRHQGDRPARRRRTAAPEHG